METPEHSRKQLKELFSLLNALRGMNRKIGLRRATLSFINLTRFFFPSALAAQTHSTVAGDKDRPAHQQRHYLLCGVELEAFFASLSLHTEVKCIFYIHSAPLLALLGINSSRRRWPGMNGNFITDRSISHSRAGREEGCRMTRVVSETLMVKAEGSFTH